MWFLMICRALALAVVVILAISPPLSVSAQQPRRGGALRVAFISEPPTLDQHWTTNIVTTQLMYHVYEGLFALTSDHEPRPMLVDRWTMSADRLTYTFTLRGGVKFHHGGVLTSEDVRASLERWGRISAQGRALWANVRSITTPDPLTVVLRLRDPYGLLLLDLAVPMQGAVIYPKEVIDEAGAGPVRRFIGTGPYRFVEYLPDRHVRLDRFEGYASRTETPDLSTGRKHAYLDSIFGIPVPDVAVRIAGVKRGEFHFAQTIAYDDYDRLRADPDVVPLIVNTPSWLAAVFNHRAGLMTNRKIRQSFQAALNHEAVLRAAFGPPQFWRLDPGLVPREHPMWTDTGRELFNQKSPERARQLLADAGYRSEPLRVMATMDFAFMGTAAEVIKPMLERAGFVVDLQFMDWATLASRRARPELWDVFITGFVFVPDPAFLLTLQPGWPGWFDNRDMNSMMALLRRHSDPKVRHDLWKRMQKLWYEEAASIKLGDYFSLDLLSRGLKGYATKPGPTRIFWNAWLEGR